MNRRTKKHFQQEERVKKNSVNIDYDKLTQAIVAAQTQVEEKKAKEQEKQEKERLKKWHEITHCKNIQLDQN